MENTIVDVLFLTYLFPNMISDCIYQDNTILYVLNPVDSLVAQEFQKIANNHSARTRSHNCKGQRSRYFQSF